MSQVQIHIKEITNKEILKQMYNMLRTSPSIAYLSPFDKWVRDVTRSSDIIGAFANGELIGFIVIKYLNWYMAEIKYLYVREDFRGKGLAKGMVFGALLRIKEKGKHIVIATVNVDNVISLHIFRDIYNFEIVKTFKTKYNRYVHLLMKVIE